MEGGAHQDAVRGEFAYQAGAFGTDAVRTPAEAVEALIELVPKDPDANWLEVACGHGLVGREVARRVGVVQGVDLTPEMIETAREALAADDPGNLFFSVGDATELEFGDDSFDGAITRFSLHHIPRPQRVFAELERVVRPGGYVVVADHTTDPDLDAAAWHQEIERLRDPSHWAWLTPEALRGMGEAAGLVFDQVSVSTFALDLDRWVARGSGGPEAADLIAEALANRPPAAESLAPDPEDPSRLLFRFWVGRWRVPDPAEG